MNNLNDFLSFWGSLASIVALAITVLGGFVAFLRWDEKRRKKELAEFARLKELIAARARSATTQGKRLDLFVYYQSLLSNQRFAHIVREIRVASVHLIAALCWVFLSLRQTDALYYFDELWPTPQPYKTTLHYAVLIELVIFTGLNIRLRMRTAKEYRQLRESANGLVEELEAFLA
jgi:hypothetical protein